MLDVAVTVVTAGYSLAKKLRNLPRADAAEVLIASLNSAYDAVLDCYDRARRDSHKTLTKDDKARIKRGIDEFRKFKNQLKGADTKRLEEKIAELSTAAAADGDMQAPSSFAPLVDYACQDMPPGVRETFAEHFESAAQLRFRKQVRDNERVFRLLMFGMLQHLEAERGGKLDASQEQVLTAANGVERSTSLARDQLLERTDIVGPAVRRSTAPTTEEPAAGDPRDLLKSYPEPQPKWVGRVGELAELHAAWQAGEKRVYSVVGFGGQGKSALARRFTEVLRRDYQDPRRPVVVWWSFYLHRSADEFFSETLKHFDIPLAEQGTPLSAEQRAARLIDLLRAGVDGRPVLAVLDGLETLQDDTVGREGVLTDLGLRELLRGTLNDARPDTPASGMILVTTREALVGLRREDDPRFGELTLEQLSTPDGVALLTEQYGLAIEKGDAEAFVKEVRGHALTLTLTGALLTEAGATTVSLAELREFIVSEEARVTDGDVTRHAHRLPGYVLRHCGAPISAEERQFMRLLSCCVRPATRRDIEEVFLQPISTPGSRKALNDKLVDRDYTEVRNRIIGRLCRMHLIDGNEQTGYDMHPLVRRHFYEQEPGKSALTAPQRKAIHSRFFDVLPARQKKHHPDTLEEMQPLIDAVLHGCRAGRADEAHHGVLYVRISRKDTRRTTVYLSADLGAVETELELIRAFFPGADFSARPIVSSQSAKAHLIGAAAVALSRIGRPRDAVTLFGRGLAVRRAQSDWVNASLVCGNLCEDYIWLGRLRQAGLAGADALRYAERASPEHLHKGTCTQFSNGYVGTVAALCGDEKRASRHFCTALTVIARDWLSSLDGGWHSTSLAQRGELSLARYGAENNARWCAQGGGLYDRTFSLAAQALVERLAWAAEDRGKRTLDQMYSYAAGAVEVGRRSGFHFYLSYALLEAGRCAVTRARFEAPRRQEWVAEAERYLDEAEERARYGEYRLILADAHVARAELAKLASDDQKMREHCREAIAICDDPDCGYAWAKQDAEKLLAG